MSVVNRQWIQNPDKNYLSFSFGLMVMSGFMVLFGGFCAAFSAAQVRYDQKKSEEKPRYAGHMIKPAPPIYWWDPVPLLTLLYWSLLDGKIFSCYWTVYQCIFSRERYFLSFHNTFHCMKSLFHCKQIIHCYLFDRLVNLYILCNRISLVIHNVHCTLHTKLEILNISSFLH